MLKNKRKSGSEPDNNINPKKRITTEPKGTNGDPKKKFSKAAQSKKEKPSGKPKFKQSKEDKTEKSTHGRSKTSKVDKEQEGDTNKNRDSKFHKNKGGNYKTNKVSFQKGKGGGGAGQPQADKPVWSEMKKKKKELRLERRKAKSTAQVFEISHKAKALAAQIQRKVIQDSVREKLCTELHSVLKGQYVSLALTHDLSRVIQVLLKYSSEDIRIQVSEELLPIIVQMIQSKYSHHSVKRILKYGVEGIKEKLIQKLYGSVVTLAAHSISAPVLDYAYGEHASNKQKVLMQQEFYGDIYKNSKDVNVKCLRDAYKHSPEMKEAILSTCKSNIQRVLDKNLHDGELLHSVLYQYMCECTVDEQAELITTLSPLIVPLSNSLPGVNAACLCVWRGTNKDKKTILKVVKEHAVALSKHKTGYRLLLAIFDSVDDTVLVKKAIVSTIAKGLKEIAVDHWGKMVLHWLVKPNDPATFHPTFVKELKEGAASGSSKKNPDVRVAELREAIIPALYEDIQADAKFWIRDPTMALLIVAVLTTQSPSKEVMSELVKVICQPDWTIQSDGTDHLGIDDAGIHLSLKKIAQNDKKAGDVTFGATLAEELSDETLKIWLTKNRACFVLIKLIENNSKEVASSIIDKIKPHYALLQKQSTPGANLLLLKL